MQNLQEFIERVELERRFLAIGVPHVALKPASKIWEFSDGWSIHDSRYVALSSEGLMPTDQLRREMLPLFFAAGWKILDSLAEFAIGSNGRDVPRSAFDKGNAIVEHSLPLPPLPAEIWNAAVGLYCETRELRNSLMHRTARVSDGKLYERATTSAKNSSSAELTTSQQRHFCQFVQLLIGAIERSKLGIREINECRYLLWELRSVHQRQTDAAVQSPVMRVRYHLGPDRVLRVKDILQHVRSAEMNPALSINLELVYGSDVYEGELENVSEDAIVLDLENLPPWLQLAAVTVN